MTGLKCKRHRVALSQGPPRILPEQHPSEAGGVGKWLGMGSLSDGIILFQSPDLVVVQSGFLSFFFLFQFGFQGGKNFLAIRAV